MAAKLQQLGVDVTSVFYPADENPPLPHEYQFHLKDAAARSALDFDDRVPGTHQRSLTRSRRKAFSAA